MARPPTAHDERMTANDSGREKNHGQDTVTACPACERADHARCEMHRVEHNHVNSQWDDYECPSCGVDRAMREGRECVPCRSDRQRVLPDGSVEFIDRGEDR